MLPRRRRDQAGGAGDERTIEHRVEDPLLLRASDLGLIHAQRLEHVRNTRGTQPSADEPRESVPHPEQMGNVDRRTSCGELGLGHDRTPPVRRPATEVSDSQAVDDAQPRPNAATTRAEVGAPDLDVVSPFDQGVTESTDLRHRAAVVACGLERRDDEDNAQMLGDRSEASGGATGAGLR